MALLLAKELNIVQSSLSQSYLNLDGSSTIKTPVMKDKKLSQSYLNLDGSSTLKTFNMFGTSCATIHNI